MPPPPDESMGAEASLRYQKARLAVTLEELERLRALLAEKTARVASAEASVRELQQKAGLASRSERSLQAALEREKANNAEGVKRAAALERELSLLRKTDAEAAKKEKAQGADQRSKDVWLNRALRSWSARRPSCASCARRERATARVHAPKPRAWRPRTPACASGNRR